MIYTVNSTGEKTQIELEGRLTFADYGTFREITKLFEENNSKSCEFSLDKLEFIDSAGLGMLLIAREKLHSNNGQVILKNARGQVRKMLDLGHLHSLFVIETSGDYTKQ